jgi:predicted HicB family RNase H-like nuclease
MINNQQKTLFVRLDPNTHKQIKSMCVNMEISMNDWVCKLIEKEIEKFEA